MYKTLTAAALYLCMAPALLAQEVIAEYYAWLDPQDTENSSGTRLDAFGQVLAQDRANYHRFGIRQQHDGYDPIFSDRAMRARLPALYQAGNHAPAYIVNDVMYGQGHYVYIRVVGYGNQITHIEVYEGAG